MINMHKKYRSFELLLLAGEVQMLILMRSIRAADGSMNCKDISLWKIRETYFSGEIQGKDRASCVGLLHSPSNGKENCLRQLLHQCFELGESVSLEFSYSLSETQILDGSGVVKLIAQFFDPLLCKGWNFLQVYVVIGGADGQNEAFLILHPLKAFKPGQEIIFGSCKRPEVRQFSLEDLVGGIREFLANGDSEYWSEFLDEPNKFIIFFHHLDQVLPFSLGKQIVVQGQRLQFIPIAGLKRQALEEAAIPEALIFVESPTYTLLQEPNGGNPEHFCIFAMYALLKTAIQRTLQLIFKLINGRLVGVLMLEANSGVLGEELGRLVGKLLVLVKFIRLLG